MFKVTKTINRQAILNIFTTALEGGSNYWYFIPSTEVEKVRRAVPKRAQPCFSEAVFEAVIDHGISIDVCDVENEDEIVGVITPLLIEKRLQELYDSEYAWALNLLIEEDYDAECADVIFQYIVIGEIVYS